MQALFQVTTGRMLEEPTLGDREYFPRQKGSAARCVKEAGDPQRHTTAKRSIEELAP